MTRNQLPEGVGKKIVEALKRQAEADITSIEETSVNTVNSLPLTEIEELPELKYEVLQEVKESNETENLIIEETPQLNFAEELAQQVQTQPQPQIQPQVQTQVQPQLDVMQSFQQQMQTQVQFQQNVQPQIQEAAPMQMKQVINEIPTQSMFGANTGFVQEQTYQKPTIKSPANIALPPNVQILKGLINSLPVGVTKQTGAQIIRQTLEAMGIPMNGVLKEAQMFQEELNSSTRECMIKIQECKTQVMQLERNVQEYQQHMTQINDIVSLFILTDK